MTATFVEVKAPEWGLAAGATLLVLASLGVGYQFVLMAADYQYLIANVGSTGTARTAASLEAAKLNPFNDMYLAEVGVAYRDQMIANLNAAQQAQSSGAWLIAAAERRARRERQTP